MIMRDYADIVDPKPLFDWAKYARMKKGTQGAKLPALFWGIICNKQTCPIWADCKRQDWPMCWFYQVLAEHERLTEHQASDQVGYYTGHCPKCGGWWLKGVPHPTRCYHCKHRWPLGKPKRRSHEDDQSGSIQVGDVQPLGNTTAGLSPVAVPDRKD